MLFASMQAVEAIDKVELLEKTSEQQRALDEAKEKPCYSANLYKIRPKVVCGSLLLAFRTSIVSFSSTIQSCSLQLG